MPHAWDVGRDVLRSFSVDRITRWVVLEERAFDVPEAALDTHTESSVAKQTSLWCTAECDSWHRRDRDPRRTINKVAR